MTVLAQAGGKISSIQVKGIELLQAPLKPIGMRTYTMPFSESDASGWDECLPSVSACTIATETGLASVPDHGDLWRVPWQTLKLTTDSATMQGDCFSLPLRLVRSMLLAERGSGWELQMLYSLTNIGASSVPWAWAAHPLFAVEEGDRIVLPENVTHLRLEGSANERLGKKEDSVAWPVAELSGDTTADLSRAHSAQSSFGDKLFTSRLQTGWCCLERPSIGLRLTVEFNVKVTPYLGLWLCYGGWPDGEGAKQQCVALEPTTAPFDSLAADTARLLIKPGETVNWPMTLRIERTTSVTSATSAS